MNYSWTYYIVVIITDNAMNTLTLTNAESNA